MVGAPKLIAKPSYTGSNPVHASKNTDGPLTWLNSDGNLIQAGPQSEPSGEADEPSSPAAGPAPVAYADETRLSGAVSHASPAPSVVADPVSDALSDAIRGATAAGKCDVVGQLAQELEARRRARDGIVDLDVDRRRRGGK